MNQGIFVSSTMMWHAPLDELMRTAYECGFSGIEMWAQQFLCCGYEAGRYRRLAERYDLATKIHATSWDLNLSSLNDAVRQASLDQVAASIRLGAFLGASEVTVHPGHMTMPCWKEQSRRLLTESLERVAEFANQEDVPVSLEIMEKTRKEFVTDAASMQSVTRELFPFFRYTVDVAHCDSTVEVDELEAALPNVSKFHISNRKGPTYHTALDDGDFEFVTLLPHLLSYGIPLVLEGYDDSIGFGKIHHNGAYLRAVVPEAMRGAGAIGQEAVSF